MVKEKHRKFKQKTSQTPSRRSFRRKKIQICLLTNVSPQSHTNNHTRLHDPNKLKCDHCKLTFRDQSKYEDHIQKHANVKKQCHVCGKQVKFMKAHMDHHNSPRNHSCTFCEKKFIRPQEFVANEKLHTGRNCSNCHICDKKFNRQNSLKAPLIRHTSKNFICYRCGKRFYRNDELGRHILKQIEAY